MKQKKAAFVTGLTMGCFFLLISCGTFPDSTPDLTTSVILTGGGNAIHKDSVAGKQGIVFVLVDSSTQTCAFTTDATSVSAGIQLVTSANPSSNTCTNVGNCILCTTSATATTCNISCAGSVPSTAAVAADVFNIYVTYTAIVTSTGDGFPAALRISGSITDWPEFDYTTQANTPTYNTLSSAYAGCDGNPDMNAYADPLSDANSIAITSTTAFVQDPFITTGGTNDPKTCTLNYQFKAAMPLTGADVPGSVLTLTRGSISMTTKVCDEATSCN